MFIASFEYGNYIKIYMFRVIADPRKSGKAGKWVIFWDSLKNMENLMEILSGISSLIKEFI